MPFDYDVHTHGGLLRLLFTFSGTVVPQVMNLPTVHLLIVLHLTLWVYFRNHPPDWQTSEAFVELSRADVKVITAMTTLFEVFYTVNTYKRFLSLHKFTHETFQSAHRFLFLLQVVVGAKGQGHVKLVARWIRVSLFFFCADLKGAQLASQHLDSMTQRGMLTKTECEALGRISGSARPALLQHWIARAAYDAYNEVEVKIAPTFTAMMVRLIEIQSSQQDLIETQRMAIPFQYFHLLHVMVCVNSFLWCYAMALNPSIFGPLVFVSTLIIFVGMLELAKALADPFGDDEVDFPVAAMLNGFCVNQLRNVQLGMESCDLDIKAILALEQERNASNSSDSAWGSIIEVFEGLNMPEIDAAGQDELSARSYRPLLVEV